MMRSFWSLVFLFWLGQAWSRRWNGDDIRQRLENGSIPTDQAVKISQYIAPEMGKAERNLVLFGSQARAAARILAGSSCLSASLQNPESSWLVSRDQVRSALAQAVSGASRHWPVFVVLEHLEGFSCQNRHVITNLFASMDDPELEGRVVFLFLWETDEGADSHQHSHIKLIQESVLAAAECTKDHTVNIKAFLGRLAPVAFDPVPNGTTADTQAVCGKDSISGSGTLSSSPWYLNPKVLITGSVLLAIGGAYFVLWSKGQGASPAPAFGETGAGLDAPPPPSAPYKGQFSDAVVVEGGMSSPARSVHEEMMSGNRGGGSTRETRENRAELRRSSRIARGSKA